MLQKFITIDIVWRNQKEILDVLSFLRKGVSTHAGDATAISKSDRAHIKSSHTTSLIQLRLPSRNAKMIWRIGTKNVNQAVIERLLFLLIHCHQLSPSTQSTWYPSPIERASHAYAHLGFT